MDYAPTIRAEIEEAVARLKRRLEGTTSDGIGYVDGEVKAQYVELGWQVNTHKGRDVYREGETICGLPVSIGGVPARTVRVGADAVPMAEEYDAVDETGLTVSVRHYTIDLHEQVTL